MTLNPLKPGAVENICLLCFSNVSWWQRLRRKHRCVEYLEMCLECGSDLQRAFPHDSTWRSRIHLCDECYNRYYDAKLIYAVGGLAEGGFIPNIVKPTIVQRGKERMVMPPTFQSETETYRVVKCFNCEKDFFNKKDAMFHRCDRSAVKI